VRFFKIAQVELLVLSKSRSTFLQETLFQNQHSCVLLKVVLLVVIGAFGGHFIGQVAEKDLRQIEQAKQLLNAQSR